MSATAAQQEAALRDVARATASRERADRDYREAVQAAATAGASQTQIARAAGVTRQAIQKML